MKKLISITSMILAIILFGQGCTKPEETGAIYGTVTDFATGEPVKNVNVKLLPNGKTTITGSDGTYSFQELAKGQYTLSLSKAGYENLDVSVVVDPATGINVCKDIQIKQEVALLIDPDCLDFGAEADDVSRLFNIVNNSGSTLTWQITKTAEWIQSVSEMSGTLSAGSSRGIVVVIDRNKLQQGENTTTLHVTSNNGNQQLTVTAKRVDVITLEATSVNSNSAVLNGKINSNINYTEKGFYYGKNHNLSNRIPVSGNGVGFFSGQITGLEIGTTYYFKAYCIHNGIYLYGEEKSLQFIPSFEYNGHTYWVAPDPGNSMTRSVAYAYCDGLSLYGCSDWRLPTIEELLQMYANKDIIGGFQSTEYWGSDQNTYWSFYVDFTNGMVDSDYNGQNPGYHHVRPVRVAN